MGNKVLNKKLLRFVKSNFKVLVLSWKKNFETELLLLRPPTWLLANNVIKKLSWRYFNNYLTLLNQHQRASVINYKIKHFFFQIYLREWEIKSMMTILALLSS